MSPLRSTSMICDVTLMYSPKLFFSSNGCETDWVDFLTITHPVKLGSTHMLLVLQWLYTIPTAVLTSNVGRSYRSVNLCTSLPCYVEVSIWNSNVSKTIDPEANVKTSYSDISVVLITRSFSAKTMAQLCQIILIWW